VLIFPPDLEIISIQYFTTEENPWGTLLRYCLSSGWGKASQPEKIDLAQCHGEKVFTDFIDFSHGRTENGNPRSP
jgi:hypothetical protein